MKMAVEDITVAGVDPKDYPDFSDAYFSGGQWIDTGEPLNGDELDKLAVDYPELLNQMAVEYYI